MPSAWTERVPTADDVAPLTDLLRAHEKAGRGWPSTTPDHVQMCVAGRAAATRQHLIAVDEQAKIRVWVSTIDRAEGRVMVDVVVDPELPPDRASALAAWGYTQARELAQHVVASRGVPRTQLDAGAFADDTRQQTWLAEAGYSLVRHWWQMSRPVTRQESEPPLEHQATAEAGVVIRRVAQDPESGMPEESDVATVHAVLEESFADHFNHHTEDFGEFYERLRADPGHRWDHWWVADVDGVPAGALIATATLEDGGEVNGSYVEYLGVTGQARGRGVAKALLQTVIADAAARGRSSVGLEVDADSPTGADRLYQSMGWQTKYITQSWHRMIDSAST